MLLKDTQMMADREKAQKEQLAKELEENRKLLKDFQNELERERTKSKELETQLQLEKKSALTLPKKQSKLQQLKEKTKTIFQQLKKREKFESENLVARIEIKTS